MIYFMVYPLHLTPCREGTFVVLPNLIPHQKTILMAIYILYKGLSNQIQTVEHSTARPREV